MIPESPCLFCSNADLRSLPLDDPALRGAMVRNFIQGMKGSEGIELMKTSRRKGICMVERCALLVEAPCGRCHGTACLRCSIAGELRAAEDRLNADRDAELRALGTDDQDRDDVVDAFVSSLCREHRWFGHALLREWYGRRSSPPPQWPSP